MAAATETDPTGGWDIARLAGLAEPAAVGWALAGYLQPPDGLARDDAGAAALITGWTDLWGPTAYLWVLAGFAGAEATAMRDAETTMSEEQLRVMVALAGVTLPDGI
ncbi:hypothetical protein [Tessaracoccus sp.]